MSCWMVFFKSQSGISSSNLIANDSCFQNPLHFIVYYTNLYNGLFFYVKCYEFVHMDMLRSDTEFCAERVARWENSLQTKVMS